MKNILPKPVLVAMVLLLACSRVPAATWVQTNGPTGGTVQALAVCGNHVFAGISGAGIFLSTYNGASWAAVNSGITNLNVQSFAVSGDTVYAGSSVGGIFMSGNLGAGWTSIGPGFQNRNIRSLAKINNTIFATTLHGVLRSGYSGAAGWGAVDSTLTKRVVSSLVTVGANLYAGTDSGMYVSADNAATWTAINAAFPSDRRITCLAVIDSIVFACLTNGSGVYTFIDGQSTGWTWVNTSLPLGKVNSFAVNGTDLLAATDTGVYVSSNYGTSTWKRVNVGLQNPSVTSLAVCGSNLFAGTNGGGVYRCAGNYASAWTVFNAGLNCASVACLAWLNNATVCAGTSGSGVFMSPDSGASWIARDSGLGNMTILSLAITDNSILAGTPTGVYRSPKTAPFYWTLKSNGLPDSCIISLAYYEAISLAGTRKGLFYSSTYGDTWQSPGSYPARPVNIIAFCGNVAFSYVAPNNTNHIWPSIYVSTYKGTSNWRELPLTTGKVNTSCMVGYGYPILYDGDQGIFRTEDNGTTWTEVDSGLVYKRPTCLVVYGSNIVAGFSPGGVAFTVHPATMWTPISNTGLADSSIRSALLNDKYIFAGTVSRGVWRTAVPQPVKTLDNVSDAGPHDERAAFNVTSSGLSREVMSFSLVNAHPVSIRICDLFGREVASFFDKNSGPGTHAFYWNTDKVAAGCYTVQMRAGSETYVKSVPVVR